MSLHAPAIPLIWLGLPLVVNSFTLHTSKIMNIVILPTSLAASILVALRLHVHACKLNTIQWVCEQPGVIIACWLLDNNTSINVAISLFLCVYLCTPFTCICRYREKQIKKEIGQKALSNKHLDFNRHFLFNIFVATHRIWKNDILVAIHTWSIPVGAPPGR